jgi:Cdc6-like AAA superfamily ATPase
MSQLSSNTSIISDMGSLITLTSSQNKTVDLCLKLLPRFKILVIKGETSSGKYLVAKELFQRLQAHVVSFDLCEFAGTLIEELSSQYIIKYLDSLLHILFQKMNLLESSRKRQRVNLSNDFLNLSLGVVPKQLGIIYIRHYNRITDVLNDSNTKLRFLLPLILKSFTEKLPDQIKIVITAHGCILPECLHWTVELVTTRDDMEAILRTRLKNEALISRLLKISRTVPVGRILFCLNYAEALSVDENSFVEAYRKALSKFSGTVVDVEKNIPLPVTDSDLVGLENILDQIRTSIINPMNIPYLPIKKGMLLCGPPGTGKSSTGRWLAHQIKGKFYSIGNDVGKDLIDVFDSTVRRARDNAPAVIFIDDCDNMFDHDEIYRSFLTILDGLESNKRNDVCVILTCMNLKKIPASLIRGGRLEMVLFTELPNNHNIQTILKKNLNKMITILTEFDPLLSSGVENMITKKVIEHIALKMTGWNYADIRRCINDVTRLLVARKEPNLEILFDTCIKQINTQYTLCGKCESTDVNDQSHNAYIS